MAPSGYSQALLISIAIIFPLLGFLLVCVRFWMRRQKYSPGIGTDDWLIALGSTLVLGMGVNAILGTVHGTMGRDNQNVSAVQVETQNKIDYAQLTIEKPAYGAIKLSVLFFYRRIFWPIADFQKVNNVIIALVAAWTVAFFGASVFMCGVHLDAFWSSMAAKMSTCANEFIILLCFAITDVLTNVLIVWMPYPQVRKLQQIGSKQRRLVVLVFAIGGLDTVFSFVRMIFIILTQTVPAFEAHFHYRQSTAPTFWTVLEVGIGVIAATLPALAPLLRGRRSSSALRLDG